jgi:membrane-associated phospholipid phosphatase
LLIAWYSAPDVLHAFLWWIVTIAGISIAPLLFVRRGVRRGYYTDHHVSVREQRFVPLLFGLVSIATTFVLLLVLHVAIVLIATVSAVIVSLVISIVVTRFWKISLHLVGIAGSVTVFILLFGPLFLLLSPLVVLVGWARWKVHAHTPLQGVAGTVLAVSSTIVVFWLFHLI